MFTSLVITFREALEAVLVVVIVSAYLKRSGQFRYIKDVWIGVAAGAGLSVALAYIFSILLGGLAGRAEKLFEGTMMLFAVGLITWLIVWMMFQKHAARRLIGRVEAELGRGGAFGICALVAAAILREGVETVIFLNAVESAGGASLLGGLAGAFSAVLLGWLLYTGAAKIRIKTLFNISSAVLILFAAGLTSHAVHEFQEAAVIPSVLDPLYDITWIMGKTGAVGGTFHSLFGYTGSPTLMEFAAYVGYFMLTYVLYRNVRRVAQAA